MRKRMTAIKYIMDFDLIGVVESAVNNIENQSYLEVRDKDGEVHEIHIVGRIPYKKFEEGEEIEIKNGDVVERTKK